MLEFFATFVYIYIYIYICLASTLQVSYDWDINIMSRKNNASMFVLVLYGILTQITEVGLV